jgi:hypothetical protein
MNSLALIVENGILTNGGATVQHPVLSDRKVSGLLATLGSLEPLVTVPD